MTYITQVIDSTTTTPPGSPGREDAYIVAGGATGDWTGHDDEIATYRDGAWDFTVPVDGELVWDADQASVLAWNQSVWVLVGTQAPNVPADATAFSAIVVQAEAETLQQTVNDILAALKSTGIMEPD